MFISPQILTQQMLRTFLSRSPHSLFKDTRYHHLVSTTSTATDLFVSFLNQCSNAKHLYQIHGFMVPRGLDQDNLFLSRFIDACSALGFLDHGYSAFTQKTHPNIYLYNTMIKVLSRQPHSAKVAIILYNKVRATGLRSDTYTFPFALKAVVCLSVIEVGREIHGQAIRTGLDGDVHVGTALVQMYSLCGCISEARKLFDRMCFSGCISVAFWNAMVAGYAKVGDMDSARDLFERMPEKNVISWTAVITGYTQMNQSTEAIVIFRRMQLENVEPDEVAMLAALSACAQLGALELGEWIHDYIHIHGLHKTTPLCNALIDMYAKSGNIIKAVDVFENLKHKSVITWTTMIAGLALHGLGREALEMFTRMENGRIKPNDITLIAILSACSHAGLVEMGLWYFNSMYLRYGIKPKIEHYGCMINLLGRAGCLQEAQKLVREMPFDANQAIWGSLLAACKIHGDVELGERALQNLIKVEPHNSGNYTILSNLYATLGRWNEAGTMRKVMRNTGVKKMPGGSSIEVNNRVNVFSAGDRSHPKSERIYEVLSQIYRQLKMAGNVHKEY